MKKIEDSLTLRLLVDEEDDEGFDRLVKAVEDLTEYFFLSTSDTPRLRIAAKLIKHLERQRTSFWIFQPSFPQALRAAAKKLRKQLNVSEGLYPTCYTKKEQAQEDKRRFLSNIDRIIAKHYPD
jgi:hypothetical protein